MKNVEELWLKVLRDLRQIARLVELLWWTRKLVSHLGRLSEIAAAATANQAGITAASIHRRQNMDGNEASDTPTIILKCRHTPISKEKSIVSKTELMKTGIQHLSQEAKVERLASIGNRANAF